MNWLMFTLILLAAAAVEGQPSRKKCNLQLRNDQYSPFFWSGYKNICTKSLCEAYPWMPCDIARETIIDAATAHGAMEEIRDIERYFNLKPKPDNTLPYHCKGACYDNARSLQLERIFFDKLMYNEDTYQMQSRWMCLVIGPNIYYQQCGGKCRMPYGGNTGDSFCVPDVITTIDLWIYCPNATQSCHKIKFDVPLSCTCTKFRCKQDLPPAIEFTPELPPKPVVDPLSDPWNTVDVGPFGPEIPVELPPGMPLSPGVPLGTATGK
ncbi:uncharacterized protein LOC123552460 isoform X2 [Mercenaria mercenaria]|uniref:uncharacterized protein LOC123552460 isoform X2 n=1 Tax=Mercenaria mercenaria TaxID=6596 RepID=UPI00234E945A|nr:uncharacterized protein LOC123552460 isoform X2 [Mercenaria mercenaria]